MGSGSPAYPQLSFDDNPDTFVSSRKASQKSTFAQRAQSAALWVVGLLGLGIAGFLLHKSSLFTKMTERFGKKGSVNPATPGVRSSAAQSGTKTSLQKFIKSNYPTYRVPGPAKTWVDDYMKAKGITGNPPVIGFYESNELGYVFSNTYNKKLTFNGETFNTSEHALQMAKFAPLKKTNPTAYQQIKDHLSSLSGGSLQKAVKGYKYDPRDPSLPLPRGFHTGHYYTQSEWEARSGNTLKALLQARFQQHQEFRDLLQMAKDSNAIIVENAGKHDAWYGAGADGKGKNLLGLGIMDLYTQLP